MTLAICYQDDTEQKKFFDVISFFAIFGNAFGFQNQKNEKNTDNRRGDEELRNGIFYFVAEPSGSFH